MSFGLPRPLRTVLELKKRKPASIIQSDAATLTLDAINLLKGEKIYILIPSKKKRKTMLNRALGNLGGHIVLTICKICRLQNLMIIFASCSFRSGTQLDQWALAYNLISQADIAVRPLSGPSLPKHCGKRMTAPMSYLNLCDHIYKYHIS